MDQLTLSIRPEADPAAERRTRILDAAERCFVRAGFHRTTMQDVAAEAGMSPGNLYRYFRSKDVIVAGLTERDRAEVAAGFNKLEDAEDFKAGLTALGRRHFAEEPREKAVLCLENWAEASRNPVVRGFVHEFEHEVVDRLTQLITRAQARRAVEGRDDPRALAVVIATLADGLFVRRAIAPDYDPDAEVETVMRLIAGLLDGRIDLADENGAQP